MNYRKLVGAAALSLFASMSAAAPFPERELSGVIMWGAGGATDVVARGRTADRRRKRAEQRREDRDPGATALPKTAHSW